MEVFFRYKEQNYAVFKKMDGTGEHHIKQNKPEPDKYCMFSFICGILIKKSTEVEGELFGMRKGLAGEGKEKK
jgi:hypothetical protein